jgi:hypothetical protein
MEPIEPEADADAVVDRLHETIVREDDGDPTPDAEAAPVIVRGPPEEPVRLELDGVSRVISR